MSGNASLHAANRAKKDEFYTQLTDIEKELKHYKEHFRDKVVFCNCDDPKYSNFWEYFRLNFVELGLRKLIATHYAAGKRSYKLELMGDLNGDGKVDNDDAIETPLEGDGDFRSDECVELLKEADVVVTNPPFSLFREYVAQLMHYEKKFLIIGNINVVTYKEIFPLLKDGEMWCGYGFNKTLEFIMPDTYELKGKAFVDSEGKKHGFVSGICWFTNLDIAKRHEDIVLFKTFSPSSYYKYDNYDAINVDKVVDMPCDYDGVMGVPITFLDKYNPEQFEIVALGTSREHYTPCKQYCGLITHKPNGTVIKGAPINSTLAIRVTTAPQKGEYYSDNNGNLFVQPYARILIRKRV